MVLQYDAIWISMVFFQDANGVAVMNINGKQYFKNLACKQSQKEQNLKVVSEKQHTQI